MAGLTWFGYGSTDYYQIRQIRSELRQIAADALEWQPKQNNIVALAALGNRREAELTAARLPTPRLQFMGLSQAAQWVLMSSGPTDTSLLRELLSWAHRLSPPNRAVAVTHCFSILPKWGRNEGTVDLSRAFLDAADDIEDPAKRVNEMLTLADLYPDRPTFFARVVDAAAKIAEAKPRLTTLLEVADSLSTEESQTARQVSRLCDRALAAFSADSVAVDPGMRLAGFKQRIGDDAGASQLRSQLTDRLRAKPDSPEKRDAFSSLIRYSDAWTNEEMAVLAAESKRLSRKFPAATETVTARSGLDSSISL